MTLSRKTSRIYMDEYDLQGVLNVISRRLDEHSPCDASSYYSGAAIALSIIYQHDDIRDQSVFMDLFDNQLKELGVNPIKED